MFGWLAQRWKVAAEHAGYCDQYAAQKAVRNVFGTVPQIERAELRRLWRDRLEVAWQLVMRDMADQRPGAVTAAVRIATTAAVLDGLNEPQQVTVRNPSTLELEQWAGVVIAATTPQVEEWDIFSE